MSFTDYLLENELSIMDTVTEVERTLTEANMIDYTICPSDHMHLHVIKAVDDVEEVLCELGAEDDDYFIGAVIDEFRCDNLDSFTLTLEYIGETY